MTTPSDTHALCERTGAYKAEWWPEGLDYGSVGNAWYYDGQWMPDANAEAMIFGAVSLWLAHHDLSIVPGWRVHLGERGPIHKFLDNCTYWPTRLEAALAAWREVGG